MGIHFIRHYKRYMDRHWPKLYSGGLSVPLYTQKNIS